MNAGLEREKAKKAHLQRLEKMAKKYEDAEGRARDRGDLAIARKMQIAAARAWDAYAKAGGSRE